MPKKLLQRSRRTQRRMLRNRELLSIDLSSTESENEEILPMNVDIQQTSDMEISACETEMASSIGSSINENITSDRNISNDEYSNNEESLNSDVIRNQTESDTEEVQENAVPLDVDLRHLGLYENSSSESISELETDNDDSQGENLPPDEDIIDQPLYNGARITLKEHVMSIFTFSLRHGLTGVCMNDLMKLLELHCVRPNSCVKSLYKFRKYFQNSQIPIVKQFYCKDCLSLTQGKESPCENCHKISSKEDYFITFSIIDQIKKLFSRSDFRESIKYRFDRSKQHIDNYESIFDGRVCKELSHILPTVNDLFLTWYTDGISVFRLSKFCIWPFFLVINNLPENLKYKPENLIMAGLWFGMKKPIPNLFLSVLEPELTLLTTGIEIEIENLDSITVNGIIMSGTCDSPAKSLFMNMKQFNGKFGCQKCKLPGESQNHRWIYPYKKRLSLRTDDETELQAIRATNSNSVVFGVKGVSILSLYVYKPIRTTGIDIMHCVFGGVANQLIDLWFNKKFRDNDFSMVESLDLVDSRLHSLTPPSFVQRRPRSIGKDLAYWKTSEFKNWFHYYSIILLNDILPTAYLKNYEALVCALFLLNKSSISEEDIKFSEKLIHQFVSKFQILYGKDNMSSNIHNLLHLPDVVRETGPLRTMSCFPLEDINGKLKKLVHSSNSAQLQICSSLHMLMKSFSLKSHLTEGTEGFALCESFLSTKKQYKCGQRIGSSMYVLGIMKKDVIDDDMIVQNFIQNKNYFLFYRFLNNNNLYTSRAYSREITTYSKCVKYKNGEQFYYGIIQYFFKVTECDCEKKCICEGQYYAVIENIRVIKNLLYRTLRRREAYIYECKLTGCISVIDLNDLRNVCFYMNVLDLERHFVIEPVNTVEEE